MKKHYPYRNLFASFILLLISTSCFSQSWQWLKRGGSADEIPSYALWNEQVIDMDTDAQGNVFALSPIGISNADIDGVDVATYGSYSGGGDATLDYAISSFSCDGTLRWTKVLGGPVTDKIMNIHTDAQGNVYVAASLYNIVTIYAQDVHFDDDLVIPYTDGTTNGQSLFLVKYSNDGELLWVRTPEPDDIYVMESYTQNTTLTFEVDPQGNSYLLTYLGVGTFCNGAYTNSVDNTLHLFKYDADGEFIEAHPFDMVIDGVLLTTFKMVRNHNTGIIYIAGYRFDLNTNVLSFGGEEHETSMYLAAFNSQGEFLWKRGNTNETQTGCGFSGITLDAQGNIYITGGMQDGDSYDGEVFDVQGGIYQFPFVMKLDSAGNLLWKSHAQQTLTHVTGKAIAVNGNEVAITGSGQGLIWGSYDLPMVYNSGADILFGQFNRENGDILGLTQMESSFGSWDYGTSLTTVNGNYYLGIEFGSQLTIGGTTVTNQGEESDFAIAKYGPDVCCLYTVPNFSFTPNGTAGTAFSFTYTGDDYESIAWDFDGEGTSAAANPSFTFDDDEDHLVCIAVTNDCGTAEYCATVSSVLSTDIHDMATVQVYPNPVEDILTISADTDLSYTVYSVLGGEVQRGKVAAGQAQLHLESVAAGLYFIKVSDANGGQKIVKLIKK
ncbi:MAG: T9SS type A sorting domain-containing protein [Sphingobacteriales bacterium]|nr:MAG: T9SS type A sorting domain-containing protein [Sphingobacteriales bacterium]